MKLVSTQLTYLLSQRQTRSNLKALVKYLLFLTATIFVFATLFHVIMIYEGQQHSWITGFYWTLTVMSTLGFGDITFHSDLGRVFSMIVLMTGILLLLIVLPFAFIRFFYAPWLEAQIRLRAPRRLAPDVSGHVIITRYDEIARGLVPRLNLFQVPYCVIEKEVAAAAELHGEGIQVIAGDFDARETYSAANAASARLVLANVDDAANTNVTLTVREVAPNVPVAALVEDEDSIDILQLSGAEHVIYLKQRLGQQLANRVASGHLSAHSIGRYADMELAEFAVQGTQLVGRTIRDTRLRELTGLNIVAYWDRGRLLPARAGAVLTDSSVLVVAGTEDQLTQLDAMFVIYQANDNPVVVLGGGKVGRAVIDALKARGIAVNAVEKSPRLAQALEKKADKVVAGDAADRNVLMAAGLDQAPSVVLTTNDDAINIYLAIYCRRLNPKLRIVSRITHERNLEAIHRAGADFVLNYASLGVKSVMAILQERPLVILGEGADLFMLKVPPALDGVTLVESKIGAETGLNVIAVQNGSDVKTNPAPDTRLHLGEELVAIGTHEQRDAFRCRYSGKRKG